MKKEITFLSILLFVIISVSLVSAQGVGRGGGAVPIITIDLMEQGAIYDITPSRLKFEFDGAPYAIQLRRVEQEYVWFLVMTLNVDDPNNITAYVISDSFNLSVGETKEIDVDKNGTEDIFIQLNNINSSGVRSANFFIKKIAPPLIKVPKEEEIEEPKEEVSEEERASDEGRELIIEPKEKIEVIIPLKEKEEESKVVTNTSIPKEINELKGMGSSIGKKIETKEEPKSLLSKLIQFFKSLFRK